MASSLILAIDNSLDFLNMGLALDGHLIEERHTRSPLHSSQILPLRVSAMLTEAGYHTRDLSLLVVTLGPGSFTGIRVGIAFCKGLASALAIPLVGVSTLDVLASSLAFLEGYAICPLIDAKKGEVFFSFYTSTGGKIVRTADYGSLRPETLKERLPRPCLCFGSGVRLCREALAGSEGVLLISEGFDRLAAGALITTALERLESGEKEELKPIYGRRSEAEIKFNVNLS